MRALAWKLLPVHFYTPHMSVMTTRIPHVLAGALGVVCLHNKCLYGLSIWGETMSVTYMWMIFVVPCEIQIVWSSNYLQMDMCCIGPCDKIDTSLYFTGTYMCIYIRCLTVLIYIMYLYTTSQAFFCHIQSLLRFLGDPYFHEQFEDLFLTQVVHLVRRTCAYSLTIWGCVWSDWFILNILR